MSSASAWKRLTLIPGAGSNSKRVTAGPRRTSVTRASMPNVFNVSSSRRLVSIKYRITSYNVCYTKLLRFLLLCFNRSGNLFDPPVFDFEITVRVYAAGHPRQPGALCRRGHPCAPPPAQSHCHRHIFRGDCRRALCYRGRIDFPGSAVLGVVP